MTDHATPADRLRPHSKLAQAIRYLRTQSKRGYCLDRRVPFKRTTTSTILDKWARGRA